MANSVEFTLALIDKMTAPARAMASQLKAVEDQLKAIKETSAAAPKLKLPAEPMLGPGRKEFLAARRFEEKEAARVAKMKERAEVKAARDASRESARVARLAALTEKREQTQLARAAQALDRQRSAGLMRQFRERQRGELKVVRDAERAQAKHARQQIRDAKERQGAIQSALASAPGAQTIAQIKELGAGFQALAGIAPRAAMGLAAFGVAAVAAGAAVVGLVAGLGALVFAGARLAIEAAEAKGDTLDMLEAMLGTEKAAKETYGALLGITKITSASKDQLTTAAQELSAAGVTSQRQLVDSVKAIAQVESVLKGGGGKIQGVIEKAAQTGKFEVNAKKLAGTGVQVAVLYDELSRRTGVGVKQVEAQLKAGKISAEVGIAALTATIDKKFGGVAAKQAMDFGVQIQRLKDNFKGLFADVKVEPFLKALSEIVGIFDDAMPAGAAMKELLTSTFDAVFRTVAASIPYVRTFLKGLVIIALQVAIALKPVIARLQEAFGGDANKGPLTLAKTMSLIGQVARVVIGAFAAIVAFKPMWDALAATIGGITRTVGGFLQGGFTGAFTAIGTAVVNGIVAGITSTAGVLFDAATNLAKSTLAKFKNAFQIHSPSKVTMGMGVNLSLGLAQGIRAGAPAANDNFRDVITPPRVSPIAAGRAAAASVVFQEGAVQIVVQGDNARSIAQELAPLMADLFEQAALTQGTAA